MAEISNPVTISCDLVVPPSLEITIIPPEVILSTLEIGQGPAGSSVTVDTLVVRMTANGSISGHKVVLCLGNMEIGYCSSSNTDHINKAIGLSLNAALDDDYVMVAINGPVVEPTWEWIPGPIYLGSNGFLTQIIPNASNSSFLQVIGTALDNHTMVVSIQPAISFLEG